MVRAKALEIILDEIARGRNKQAGFHDDADVVMTDAPTNIGVDMADAPAFINAGIQLWDEQADYQAFVSHTHWNAFLFEAQKSVTWRDQNLTLVRHLLGHRDRIRSHGRSVHESWLVSWALMRMPTPVREFVAWSLEKVGHHNELTIQRLYEHLELWAELFESRGARSYAARQTAHAQKLGLFFNQPNAGTPWMARFLGSDWTHARYARELWLMYWWKYSYA